MWNTSKYGPERTDIKLSLHGGLDKENDMLVRAIVGWLLGSGT
jgi:hypothetical protein